MKVRLETFSNCYACDASREDDLKTTLARQLPSSSKTLQDVTMAPLPVYDNIIYPEVS